MHLDILQFPEFCGLKRFLAWNSGSGPLRQGGRGGGVINTMRLLLCSCSFPPPTFCTVKSKRYRRRINIEEKATVVDAVYGTAFFQFLATLAVLH